MNIKVNLNASIKYEHQSEFIANVRLILRVKTTNCYRATFQLTCIMWNNDIAYAMTFVKLFTIPVGGWPLQEYNTFTLVRHIIACLSACTITTTSFLNLYYNCTDIYEKIDSLMLTLCSSVGFLKLSMFHIYADNLTRNYSSAVNDYLTIDTAEKRMIMRQHAYLGRIIFYCVVIFGFITSFGLITAPFMASENMEVNVSLSKYASKYPIPSTCALGQLQIISTVYFTIFVVQCAVIMMASCAYVGNDSLFLTISLHVCGQIELLKLDFNNLGKESENVNNDFLKLLRRHQYLLNHAQLLADTISIVLLAQLFISSILICIIGFQLIVVLKQGDTTLIAKTSFPLFTFLTQLYAYAVVGDYLKSQTEEVAVAIYCSNWNSFSMKLMKNVLFIIMRSQKPVCFTVGKYLLVNLETYMTILKTSFSYLSMLRVMLDV